MFQVDDESRNVNVGAADADPSDYNVGNDSNCNDCGGG